MSTSSVTNQRFPRGIEIHRLSHHLLQKSRTLATVVWIFHISFVETNAHRIWAQQAGGEAIQSKGLVRQSNDRAQQDGVPQPTSVLQLNSSSREDRAEREFKEALTETPKEDKYVRRLTLFYIERNRYEDAIRVIAEHVKLRGVTALGYELEAELLFKQKLYDSALEATLASLKLDDHNARMHQLLGLIHIAKHQDNAAVVELQRAAELDPNQPSTRYFLARVLYTTGNYAVARDQFLACLNIDPTYRKALENLGLCYEALQSYEEATEAYRKAIRLEEEQKGPKHAEPYAFYGAMLARLGESEKAVAVLGRGVEVSEKSFVANYHLGRVLLNLGEIAEAERFLIAAADLDPKFSRTYYLLGNLRQKQNRKDDAARYHAKFQELDQVPENRVFPLTDR